MKRSLEERARIMRSIKCRDTAPELVVRRIAHAMGYRFRLHRKDLPGTPDLVFVSRRKVIFVNGCFWHRHGCKLTRVPKGNADYWIAKFNRNCVRDKRNAEALAAKGWKHLVIWECQTHNDERVQEMLMKFLR
jgi:DNA mismatch endonuclease, patch repair protein